MLMIGECPGTVAAAADSEMSDKCATGGGDFVSGYPVTGAETGHTYKNAYCAWCHGERRRVVYWKPAFKCDGRPAENVRLEDASDGTLLHRNGLWYYADYANRQLHPCYIQLQPPGVTPRPCAHADQTLVDGCPAGTPGPLARACASSAAYLLFEYKPNGGDERSARVFRNADCARCNNVTAARLKCAPSPPRLSTTFGFRSLFSVKGTGRRRLDEPCAPDELYDVSADKCRNVIRDELPAACRTYVTFAVGEYDGRSLGDDGTAYVYAYKQRVRGRRPPSAAVNGGALEVCAENVDGPLRPYTMPVYGTCLVYAGVAGSSVSVVALVAHLVRFGGSAEPKNLPDKNLASLAVSLLLGYACYVTIAVDAVPAGDGLPCLASALAMHFGFLAAFAWMFVMSVDVWIVLYAANKKFRVTDGKRNGRFAAYSAVAWLAPAAVTALAAALQLSAVDAFPELRPNFQHTCWFRNPQALVALFVLPAGVTIAANYVSFVGTVRLITGSRDGLKTAANNSSTVNRSRNNLKIYMRLSLMMGLAWAFGLAGAVTDSDVVWTLYTVLNSLQGAFIFLAFDYNWKAVRTVFRKLPSVSELQTTTTITGSTINNNTNITTAATPLSGSI